jgi:hypothetical protein
VAGLGLSQSVQLDFEHPLVDRMVDFALFQLGGQRINVLVFIAILEAI